MCSYRSRLVFSYCFLAKTLTFHNIEYHHVRFGGIFSDNIITNFLLILIVKYV